MDDLIIDPFFEKICEPLDGDELIHLEELLLSEGCREPIITWANHQGTILDGHTRYRLCRKHDIKFKVKSLVFRTRDEAALWIRKTQLGRRNINAPTRALFAAALINTSEGRQPTSQNCEVIDREKAAKLSGLSPRTIDDAKKINDHASASLVHAVKAKEVSIATAAAVAELPKSEQKKLVEKGPEAVAEKAKKLKAPKQYKDSFDTGKLDKELKKDKKPGSVKKQWDDQTFIEAAGQFGKEIDAAYAGFLKLIEECHANCGGRESDVARVKRATNYGKAESHKLLRGMIDGFRVWRPAK